MKIPCLTLNNGVQQPFLGLGTWEGLNPETSAKEVADAIEVAIDAGYRHFDCASVYGNEKVIGQALKKAIDAGKVKREELFITSKLWNTNHGHVREACLQTLKDLQLDYLDMYLMHWPVSFEFQGIPPKSNVPKDANGHIMFGKVTIQECWQQLEKLHDEGLAKSIGISNFRLIELLDLLKYARIKPATNQIEVHPYFVREHLVEECHRFGIKITAYSPLGSNHEGPLQDPLIAELSQKYNRSKAQILIRWSTQRGLSVIPKSANPQRVKENANIFDFEISPEDIKRINGLEREKCFVNQVETWA